MKRSELRQIIKEELLKEAKGDFALKMDKIFKNSQVENSEDDEALVYVKDEFLTPATISKAMKVKGFDGLEIAYSYGKYVFLFSYKGQMIKEELRKINEGGGHISHDSPKVPGSYWRKQGSSGYGAMNSDGQSRYDFGGAGEAAAWSRTHKRNSGQNEEISEDVISDFSKVMKDNPFGDKQSIGWEIDGFKQLPANVQKIYLAYVKKLAAHKWMNHELEKAEPGLIKKIQKMISKYDVKENLKR